MAHKCLFAIVFLACQVQAQASVEVQSGSSLTFTLDQIQPGQQTGVSPGKDGTGTCQLIEIAATASCNGHNSGQEVKITVPSSTPFHAAPQCPSCPVTFCPSCLAPSYHSWPAPSCPTLPAPSCPSCPAPTCPTLPVPSCPTLPVPSCPTLPVPSCPTLPVPSCPTLHAPACPTLPVPSCPTLHAPACPTLPVPTCPTLPVPSCPTLPVPSCPTLPVPSCPTLHAPACPTLPAPACPTCPPPPPSATSPSPPALLPGYERVTGLGCYKYHTSPKPWTRAKEICEEEGTHLLILNSESESQAVCNIMNRDRAQVPWNSFESWLGLVESNTTQHDFYTVLGVPLLATGFSRWWGGEPGSQSLGDNVFLYSGNGGLMDKLGAYSLAFTCEMFTC